MLAHKAPTSHQHEPKRMPDLIDDGTRREAALARMSEVLVANRGLRPMQVIADGIMNQM